MAENSKIEWTDHTANIWWGCTKVHAGCDNCYAETLSKRWNNDVWGNDKPRRIINSFFNDLFKYQKKAKEAGTIHRVFVGSMMDIFEKSMPLVDKDGIDVRGPAGQCMTGDLRDAFFKFIDLNLYPNLMFLLLTKRPSNINKYIPESWKKTPPKNVMFGCSPVDQQTFETLVPQLFTVNGKKFLSIEPMLGPIDMLYPEKFYPNGIPYCCGGRECGCMGMPSEPPMIHGIDWIIVGGESGPHKRPFNINWAYDIQSQCESARVPFFFKQIDKVQEPPIKLIESREFYVE